MNETTRTQKTGQTGNDRFIIELEAGPDPLYRKSVVRVRALLKLASRAFGLKCVSITEGAGHDDSDTPPPSRTVSDDAINDIFRGTSIAREGDMMQSSYTRTHLHE